ncbi:MAG TPA: hypothetical protein VNK04_06635, partial [Gemmataceae bacterium]|nr:hypothetical protein [Gemmataceae bacterium]
MNLQETIDQPTFHRVYFSSSFYLHDAKPSGLVLEGRIPAATRKELAARGHKVEVSGDWAHGKVMAVRYGEQHGVLAGAVSPRREIGYLMGDWRALPAAGEGARPASPGRWTVARSARPASAGRSRRREIHRPAHAGLSPRVVVSPGMLWRAFW